ncbi:hypothetical protein IFM89_025444 [Coptis chinensis]|uniref:Ty3 transposon capsid-like protein domain-containing protein n=1 Tax=Coptis chinensis TaxID=261450 RepID=A0A835HT54_9MAGN|nr:hypothetical protein IFM89_025444 [Coptis chinensis]
MGLPSGSRTPIATTTDDEHSTNGLRQKTLVDMDDYGKFLKTPRLDFPRFDGVNPRAWVRKGNQFFYIHPMEESTKVKVASLYLEGRADSWFLEYQEGREIIEWTELTEQIYKRFEEVGQDNYVGNFNKLVQTDTIEEYYECFETLKAIMVSKNKELTEENFVLSFLSGLEDEIRTSVQMFKPTNLHHAWYLAKMQESTLEAQFKKTKPVVKTFPNTTSYFSKIATVIQKRGEKDNSERGRRGHFCENDFC